MKKLNCLITAVLFMVTGQGLGVDFSDGGTHNIDYTIMTTDARVDYQTPGMQTTVNLLNGGYISGELNTYQDSRTNITGGSVGGQLQAHDSSRVNISGGVVSGRWDVFGSSQVTISGGLVGYMYTNDSSRITMSGGSVDSFLMTYGGSQLTMSGGSVRDYVYSWDVSHITLSGGEVGECLNAFGNSQVTISDGSIIYDLIGRDDSRISMFGGTIGRDIKLEAEAILTINGYGFAIDGNPFGYGEITSILGGDYSGESYRRLTGTLANGDIIDNYFRIGDSGSIVLVPEPATLLLFSLCGFVLGRRK